jgi:hypothetical protein
MSTRRIGTAMSRRRIGLGLRLLGLAIVGALSFGALAGAKSGPCGGAGYGGYGGYGGYNSHARCDVTPPRVTLKTPKSGRKAALRRGVAASLTCSEPCTARLALTLNRAGASKLKLGRKPVVAGRATVAFRGRLTVQIGLSKPVRKALRRAHHPVSFQLGGTVTDGAGNRAALPARTVAVTR